MKPQQEVTLKKIEYNYKKNIYMFPSSAKIYQKGGKISVEINDKKINNLSDFIIEFEDSKSDCKIGLPITGSASELAKEYQAITDFLIKNPSLSLVHFEYATSHDLSLCTFFKSLSIIQSDLLMQDIKKTMPFLINIFKRPLIHLKEVDVILSIDAVKRINHQSIRHLSKHSEDWETIKNNTVTPNKLMTKIYDDDFSIYENIVFRNLIDKIFVFLRKRIYYLTEVMDIFNESVKVDAFTRFNHPKYYLAIGKLFVGFAKMENSAEILSLLNETKQINLELTKYTMREVYQKNSSYKKLSGEIKKTNILRMHKDYKHVYNLYKKLNQQILETNEQGSYQMQLNSQRNYENFIQMLTIFSATNFNFIGKLSDVIYKNNKLQANFSYLDWRLEIESFYNEILEMNIISLMMKNKKKIIKYCLIPISYYLGKEKKKHYERILEKFHLEKSDYQKYIFLEPHAFDQNPFYDYALHHHFSDNSMFYAILPVSISDINSFRRLQKIFFEMMVSTRTSKICAFCGENLLLDNKENHFCPRCKTALREIKCQSCEKTFTGSFIHTKGQNRSYKVDKASSKNVSAFLKSEKKYLFRNTVNMQDNNFICPHCGN